jgi:uncharacterized protein YciI
MKQFFIFLSDKQRHLMTKQLIQDHVTYLGKLSKEGTLRLCGPCKDGSALMLLHCSSLAEAQHLVDEDPFSHVGYYTSRKIVEFEEASEANGFHLAEVLEMLNSRSISS